ncbi:hypothetical protein BIFBRE_05116 [Bifidobacterium breve DSM 20213 = JCM 1192]|uniref:Uncharacterized protein n=1 Tax=Bifidobacterium breve DSM 20213 = JCM 1192 TaxID=518634 RepID=D4BSM4_BIFBR|nr:hypothetical protein BIFBRE_05116 [Bifidobacterium breve DSM 20213 = JCM 1192]
MAAYMDNDDVATYMDNDEMASLRGHNPVQITIPAHKAHLRIIIAN